MLLCLSLFTSLGAAAARDASMLLAASGAALAIHSVRRRGLDVWVDLERVRTQIARDLHDDIGASLSQIALLSEFASRRADGNPHVAYALREIGGLSRQVVDSMSDIVWAIDPHNDMLDDMIRRMRAFANDVFAAGDILLHFREPHPDDSPKLNPEVRRQVLLIFKESIHNIVRHAECRNVEIDLVVEQGRLTLKVSDDGKGFDTGQAYGGRGLHSIRDRARCLGGECTVSSRPHGTTIFVSVPVAGRPPYAAGSHSMESPWKRRLSA